MKRVKVLASILTCLILLHCVCLARCLGEGSRIARLAVPPCHQSHGTPAQNDVPMPLSTCLGGPALEAKSLPTLKCALDFAVLHDVIPDLVSVADSPLDEGQVQWARLAPPLLLHSVLRI
jgi:hypothetical protein